LIIPLTTLVPLPVTGPLAVAGILLAGSHVWPRRLPDIAALVTALGSCGLCLAMAHAALSHPLVYWFGGWAPAHGHVLGIGFIVGSAGAAVAAFVTLLFAATLVFAWGYFDEVHAHFHVLMLLFMAGMTGFCLTHDLFNRFVWFEVMSVAGFALTGYELRKSALAGALNFTVTNTLGAYLILMGIGLLYARLGALDFSALQAGVAQAPRDPVIDAAFVLLTTGLLIKSAQVPFHFWLADAHAVAPSPVSVIFSGAMVAIGVFGIARVYWTVFAPAPDITAVTHRLFLILGAASALVGGVMAVLQRHLKRMLAFSTISHIGLLLIAFALLSQSGLAGMFIYLFGHGLVKGALFMVAGILLAELAGIDEIALRGLGREIWPAGVAMGLGALLLAGLPLGAMSLGADVMEAAARAGGQPWVPVVMALSGGLTGGAVLRATGRIFLGLGPEPGDETRAPTEAEREKANRPLWVLLLPTVILLSLDVLTPAQLAPFAAHASFLFMHPPAATALPTPHVTPGAWAAVLLALAIAAFGLSRYGLPVVPAVSDALQGLHSGLIGDYIAWIMAGLALFAVMFAVR
jgi:multicomponent Na+:H+ antiporter subunit D